jgi:hypothetical protein
MYTPLDYALALHGWTLSSHARERLRERGVPARLLIHALTNPELTYPHHAHTVAIYGPLSVVVASNAKVVVTLRLNCQHTWSNEAAQVEFAEFSGRLTAVG